MSLMSPVEIFLGCSLGGFVALYVVSPPSWPHIQLSTVMSSSVLGGAVGSFVLSVSLLFLVSASSASFTTRWSFWSLMLACACCNGLLAFRAIVPFKVVHTCFGALCFVFFALHFAACEWATQSANQKTMVGAYISCLVSWAVLCVLRMYIPMYVFDASTSILELSCCVCVWLWFTFSCEHRTVPDTIIHPETIIHHTPTLTQPTQPTPHDMMVVVVL